MRFVLSILFILQLSVISFAQTGEDDELDSLIAVYHRLNDNDTAKIGVCCDIARAHYNVDSTILWSERLLNLADMHNMTEYKCCALRFFSWAYYYQNNYDEAMKFSYDCIRLAESINDFYYLGVGFEQLAAMNIELSDLKTAQDYIDSAKYYYYLFGDSASANHVNQELFRVFNGLGAYDLADSILDVSLEFDYSINDTTNIIDDLQSKSEMRIMYFSRFYGCDNIKLIHESKDYLLSTLDMRFGNLIKLTFSYYWLSRSMFYELNYYKYSGKRRQEVLDSIYSFCIEEQKIAETLDVEDADSYLSLSWIYYYISFPNFEKAKSLLDAFDDSEGDYELELLLLYRIYYTDIGDYDNALLYASKYSKCLLEQNSPMDIVNCTKHQAQKDFEAERERMRVAETERLFRIRTFYIVAVVLAVLLALFLLYRYIRKRQHFNELNERNARIILQNEEINQQKEEILAQRNELADINKQLTDSINYASNIQNASLPKYEVMQELFHDYFLIYRPLHIVAGDFYWSNRVGKYHVLVCADCTGHGVPGAFVSMLGISLLNEVAVNFQGEIVASRILDSMRAKLMSALGQDKDLYERGQRINMDGMDLAMVMIDYESMTMQFAGAYRPLWLWRDGEIIQYKPDKMPIGIYLGEHRYFTNHEIELRKGDVLYLFSDGIPDQFGYTDDTHTSCRHFSTKRLLKLLAEIGSKPMEEQRSIIENTVDTWKNGYKQLDDNIFIGVRI